MEDARLIESSGTAGAGENAGIAGHDARFWIPYVSPLVFDRVCGTPDTWGVAAQIDIGGFTATVERYSRTGAHGLGQITDLVGRCFGTLVDTIVAFGGAVHTFPGDSAIAIWETPHDDLRVGLERAIACVYELTQHRIAESNFSLKAGIGAGQLFVSPLGGTLKRRELLVSGDAVAQMATALGHAKVGQIVISPQAREQVAHRIADRRVDGGNYLVTAAPFVDVRLPQVRPVRSVPDIAEFVPRAVRERVPAGLQNWIGEFRHASVLLMQIGSGSPVQCENLTHAFRQVQQTVYGLGGSIVQLCHDDKGVVVLGAMGIAESHEDDPERAVQAALGASRASREAGMGGHVGVASGRIFCGLLGGRQRLEYRLVGNVLNVAGRLMAQGCGVLCDASTRKKSARVAFGPALELAVKGFSEPLLAYSPLETPNSGVVLASPFPKDNAESPIFGREAELATAREWLHHGAHSGPLMRIPLLAILGEAGIGKSHLVNVFAREAQELCSLAIVVQNSELASALPLRAARPILDQLLGPVAHIDDVRRTEIGQLVMKVNGSLELAPLLEEICTAGFEENDTTRDMPGEARANNRLNLLARVLLEAGKMRAVGTLPIIVLLEDAQWMDPPSWTLIKILGGLSDSPFRFVLTMRSIPNDNDVAVGLMSDGATTVIRVGLLNLDAVTRLIEWRVGADRVSTQLAALAHERTDGNPFFCEEFIYALQELGVMTVEDGAARLMAHPRNLSEVVPESVEKILRTRIDRMPLPLQLTLKAASVIGQHFDAMLLRQIHPATPVEFLTDELDRLVEANLLRRQREVAGPGYAFRHAITRDVTYASLLFNQRQELHAMVARALEGRPAADGDVFEIFHHWRAAQDIERALGYVDGAGTRALRQGNYHVAAEFFTFGVKNMEITRNPRDSYARWNQHLGEVLVALGRHDTARGHLEVVSKWLGFGVPRRAASVLIGVTLQAGVQIRHRLRRLRPVRGPREALFVRAAETYEQLGYIYYASGRTTRGVHAALCMLNLAERAAVSPVLARAYAAMSLTASVTPLRALGDFYENAARDVCAKLNDERTSGWVGWISSLRAAGEGRWGDLAAGTARATDSAARSNDMRLHVMATLTRAWGLHLQGEQGAAKQLAQDALGSARSHGNLLWEAWALNALAEADLGLGAYEEVVRSCQRALDILVEESDRTEEVRAGGMLAHALLLMGQDGKAQRVASQTLTIISSVELTAFNMFEGFAGVAEFAMALLERRAADAGTTPADLIEQARQACSALRQFAAVFPIARPRHWRLAGRLAAVRGQQRQAHAAWRRAAMEAENLELVNECELAKSTLARLVPPAKPATVRRRAGRSGGKRDRGVE